MFFVSQLNINVFLFQCVYSCEWLRSLNVACVFLCACCVIRASVTVRRFILFLIVCLEFVCCVLRLRVAVLLLTHMFRVV